jgi:Ferritin-like domain
MTVPGLESIEIEGTTRAQFILRGALATGAVYGFGAIAPYVSGALAATAAGDVGTLQFALSLEQLEAAFYKAALANAGLSGPAQNFAKVFGLQEAQHVKTLSDLISALGSKPAAPPKFKFGLTDQASFLNLAVQLEDTGVGAYNGAISNPRLSTPEIISALGSIVQTEGRHSATIRTVAGKDPAPNAFDKPLPPAQVKAAVQPYAQQPAAPGSASGSGTGSGSG